MSKIPVSVDLQGLRFGCQAHRGVVRAWLQRCLTTKFFAVILGQRGVITLHIRLLMPGSRADSSPSIQPWYNSPSSTAAAPSYAAAPETPVSTPAAIQLTPSPTPVPTPPPTPVPTPVAAAPVTVVVPVVSLQPLHAAVPCL